jgi:hypothetical protein
VNPIRVLDRFVLQTGDRVQDFELTWKKFRVTKSGIQYNILGNLVKPVSAVIPKHSCRMNSLAVSKFILVLVKLWYRGLFPWR